MQTTSFYINKSLSGLNLVETTLSFKPFIDHVEERLTTEDTVKGRFYRFILDHFNDGVQPGHEPETNQIKKDEYALELIYSALSPALLSEKAYLWGLSTPVPNKILYSTDAFYEFITSQDINNTWPSIITNDDAFYKQQLEYIYRLILKRLYDFTSVLSNHVYYSYSNANTGLTRYYRIHIDTSFIDIKVKGELPELEFETIENYLHDDAGVEILQDILPLSLFKLEGFSVITMEDVTPRRSIDNIREAINNFVDDEQELYKQVINSLKTLTENNDVSFGLLPFLKLNGEPVFDMTSCSQSILIQSAHKYGLAEETFCALVERYEAQPKAVFFSSISESKQQKYSFLRTLRQAGIKSYALIPVYYHKHIAGVMEVYSEKELVFYENLLSRLEFALPLIAQLLQNSIEHFNERIDAVIKDKFTSLQPSVQWKFNETAWKWLRIPKNKGNKIKIGSIVFKDVYPLYGAIDIRNSTVERNLALQQDLKRVLKLLVKTLQTVQAQHPDEQWADLINKAKHWQQVVESFITTSDEMLIEQFLESEAGLSLTHYKQQHPDAADTVDAYLDMIALDCEGPAFTHRNRLEMAMQMINGAVNNYFEQAEKQLQALYPCYFEKIRTDGVEYDIYVGQAITPKIPFTQDYLRKMRIWQLTSMVEVSRLTHRLMDQMPAALQTTQLIFIHSMPIDISFRNDERRFDVEGAYNIRYEVIKKRIDKVMLADGSERLTQPGKIALVYFTDAEAEEQISYIKQLQTQNLLLPTIERLELEELQGVAGLKALRVSVNFEE
ncbi:GAF domain-containing protein [Mucilaginibacter lacusdianchii]|uniref:GAF domain-containing protein n=1 Tax=Mucilaginibacter lacusdianchii TaxID=2684211 RepID=UPI00131B4E18|nr:GAF domain-containing protein [Mucilaginibacter sp. JXJ CY 39]